MKARMGAKTARTRPFDLESPLAIELRRIMIRLSRQLDFDRQRCLMVTSAQRGEGKSLFSSNFALVLANHLKRRVLLVDGDLRRPVQHIIHRIPRAPGFAEQLKGKPVKSRATSVANLEVLPAGEAVEHISALLSPERVSAALAHWKKEFGIIILDNPPVVPVSDPLQCVAATDGVIYVVMAGRTPREIAVRGIEILKGVGANVLGVVANNFSEVLPYYYDRKYYGYAERKVRAGREAALVAPDGAAEKESVPAPEAPNG